MYTIDRGSFGHLPDRYQSPARRHRPEPPRPPAEGCADEKLLLILNSYLPEGEKKRRKGGKSFAFGVLLL